ncbi:Atu4866 domain-containing protein [Phreatobacter cathodiphilus]|nr:Atu4866 domain-containing protein [Phreatobacter cathodiphilus]
MTRRVHSARTALLLAAAIALTPVQKATAQMTNPTEATPPVPAHPYVGMWVTPDGHIRHELLPNGRYDEARGARASAYRGRYVVRGNHIDYWDDTGFTADGTFVDADTLHHGGMVFRRQR